MSMEAIYAVPTVQLECDGLLLSWHESSALDEVHIVQQLGLPTQCELTFRDPPGPLTIQQRLTAETAFRVLLKGSSEALFDGQVTAVEQVYTAHQERVLRVRGYDRLHALRKRQTVRAHIEVTLRELAAQLVSDLGITVSAGEDSPTWPYLIQGRESDFDLLRRLSEDCGLYMTLEAGILNMVSLAGTGTALPLRWRDNLHRLSVETNSDRAVDAITATGWDTAHVEMHNQQVSTGRVPGITFQGLTAALLDADGERCIVDANAPDVRHIEALAQSTLDHHMASNITVAGTAAGDPAIRPGRLVRLDGVDPAHCGEYAVTQAQHIINRQHGYVTAFATDPPELDLARQDQSSGIVTDGVVTAINDPEGIGRVRVSLPTFNDVETDWIAVLSPGAGEGKGLMMLPEVNDRVLLLLADGDPARGIVLGGLYGTIGMPDDGIDTGEVRRYTWLTRGGQRICLDDSGEIIRMENSDGSYIELGPAQVILHANTDLTISAPDRAIRIEGHTVDFVRG